MVYKHLLNERVKKKENNPLGGVLYLEKYFKKKKKNIYLVKLTDYEVERPLNVSVQ